MLSKLCSTVIDRIERLSKVRQRDGWVFGLLRFMAVTQETRVHVLHETPSRRLVIFLFNEVVLMIFIIIIITLSQTTLQVVN